MLAAGEGVALSVLSLFDQPTNSLDLGLAPETKGLSLAWRLWTPPLLAPAGADQTRLQRITAQIMEGSELLWLPAGMRFEDGQNVQPDVAGCQRD